jgi:hypothetical protein
MHRLSKIPISTIVLHRLLCYFYISQVTIKNQFYMNTQEKTKCARITRAVFKEAYDLVDAFWGADSGAETDAVSAKCAAFCLKYGITVSLDEWVCANAGKPSFRNIKS